MGGATADQSVIELRLPPSLRFAPVVRVLAASLAADQDFAISALAEMRRAIQDVFETVAQQTVPADPSEADTAIVVRFTVVPGRVEIEFVGVAALHAARCARPQSSRPPSARPPSARSPLDGEPPSELLVVDNGRITLTKQLNHHTNTPPTTGS